MGGREATRGEGVSEAARLRAAQSCAASASEQELVLLNYNLQKYYRKLDYYPIFSLYGVVQYDAMQHM